MPELDWWGFLDKKGQKGRNERQKAEKNSLANIEVACLQKTKRPYLGSTPKESHVTPNTIFL